MNIEENALLTPERTDKLDLALDAATKYMVSCKPFFDEFGNSGMSGALYVELFGRVFSYFTNEELSDETSTEGNSMEDKRSEPTLLLG